MESRVSKNKTSAFTWTTQRIRLVYPRKKNRENIKSKGGRSCLCSASIVNDKGEFMVCSRVEKHCPWPRTRVQGQGLEGSRPRTCASRPRPRTLKIVLEANDILEDSTSENVRELCPDSKFSFLRTFCTCVTMLFMASEPTVLIFTGILWHYISVNLVTLIWHDG